MFQGFLLLLGITWEAMGLEAERMAVLLRRVRHDFGNHLQVIGGYLQMGQPERVQEYLRTVIEDINSERIIFEAQSGEASLYFYEQLLKARDMGIILRYEDIDIDSWEILKASDEPRKSLAALSEETIHSEEDAEIYLSIYEDERGLDMFFSCTEWENSSKGIRVNKE
jgi:hypothetical protein